MSLQFIYGRAGTGKSNHCFQEIKEKINGQNKIYIITPEQFSYMAEKKLLEAIGKQAVINAEVLTFNRMADRINAEVGGKNEKQITKSSKAMLVYSILKEKKQDFTFLGNSNENLELAIKGITEFKKHGVKVENIEQNIENIEDTNLKLKLEDMQKIYLEYENKLQNEYIDEDDKLTQLAKNLEKSQMFDNSYIYIDEFAGFTHQEYEILRKLMKKAKKITITSCIDPEEVFTNINLETSIFSPNKKVIDKIIKIAEDKKIKIENPVILENTYRFKNEELKHLEKNIYANSYKKYSKNLENIKLFLAANPYSEIEYIAKQIIKLVRDEGYKYSEISIITKNIENIESIAKAVFNKYGIPIYIDGKDELSQNIGVKYVLAILEIFSKNWSQESVLSYIKLGFCGIEKQEIYKIENYIKKWGIRGLKRYKEEWKLGENEEELKQINTIRKKVVEPLLKFREKLSHQNTAQEISKEIYKFLEENNFYSKLNEKISILEKNGELRLANDYKLSAENLISVLDEIVAFFKDEKITFEKYSEILKTGLNYRELGSIPQTIEQVVLGDVDRSRSHKVRAVFILGMNDGVFPSINKNEGFFNDKDREILKGLGLELAKGTLEMLFDEEFNIYKALTTAEEKLFLSYASSDKDGASLRSSVIITKIKKMFTELKEESDVVKKHTEVSSQKSTFDELLYNLREYKNGEEIDPIWFEVYKWYEKNDAWGNKLNNALKGLDYTNKADTISQDNIEKLYGKKLKTSISKLEQYKECPFSFHLKYGLKLKEADEFKLKSIDTGSFMHDVVDAFFEEVKQEDLKSLNKEEIKSIVYGIIEQKLNLKKNAIFTSSPKFIVLTNRLKKVIAESIYYIVYQMQNSDFNVLGNEVEFSKTIDDIEIVGKIDRIDFAEGEEGSFIRIIDYKSSSKSLDLNKMVTGLQIQLLTYVDIMSEKTNKEPVGMLYFNLIEPIISKNRNLSDEEIEEEIRKAFRMKGLILSDIKIIKMMDNNLETGASKIIPVTLDKSGNISATRSSVLTKEEFTSLQKKIRKLIKQIADEILSGCIEIKPTYNPKQKKSACEYCPYKTICGFNPKKNVYEYVPNKTKDQIFEELHKENMQ
ncbi:MAG: helicase-exonuclease AddAB subunit AddB [Clostridia bacterium]|nr:helicase-exonuclease AddAB subunit AddB [Clostridia bacterium]